MGSSLEAQDRWCQKAPEHRSRVSWDPGLGLLRLRRHENTPHPDRCSGSIYPGASEAYVFPRAPASIGWVNWRMKQSL